MDKDKTRELIIYIGALLERLEGGSHSTVPWTIANALQLLREGNDEAAVNQLSPSMRRGERHLYAVLRDYLVPYPDQPVQPRPPLVFAPTPQGMTLQQFWTWACRGATPVVVGMEDGQVLQGLAKASPSPHRWRLERNGADVMIDPVAVAWASPVGDDRRFLR